MQKLQALKYNLRYFAKNCLQIRTKDARIVPFVFNKAQNYLHDICEQELARHGKVRIVIVKGRQSGISTYVAARFYHKTSTNKALNTFILSHESSTTGKLFQIVKLFNEYNPIAPPVKRSNANELMFDSLASQYYVGTAGSGEVGRGGTVQLFHGSEVAMWRNTDDIETGLMESIPEVDGSEIILESTAKGLGNFFHRMTMEGLKGLNGYRIVFIPWHWGDEYEEDIGEDFVLSDDEKTFMEAYLSDYPMEQSLRKMKWRRTKISRYSSEWKFRQEYPSNVTEAFQTSTDTLIDAEDIMKARKARSIISNQAPLILGVDPARNKDRAVILFRRGREIEQFYTYEASGDDIWFADKVAEMISRYKPLVVNIDCTNSWAIHDYLKRKGFDNIRGVHFGEKATDRKTYANKRAEMWCMLRDWFKEDGVVIPDDDEFHTDLVSVPDYDETDGKIRLMRKEKIKEVSGMSPDIGDAAALTFAVRISGKKREIENKGSGLLTRKRFSRRTGGLGRR